jgi:hypothetical protein
MEKNRHSKTVPVDVLEQVQNLLKQANTLLLPYITSLTPAERHMLPKMGEKTLSFVEKSHEFAVQNPNFVPPFLDMPEFDIDFADAHNLWTLLLLTNQLHENVDDTTLVAGSEAYQAALVFYNSVKMAARQDIPGAKAVYEELKKRFPGKKRKSADETEVETENEA